MGAPDICIECSEETPTLVCVDCYTRALDVALTASQRQTIISLLNGAMMAPASADEKIEAAIVLLGGER